MVMENNKNNEVNQNESPQQNDTKQNDTVRSEEFLKRVEQAAARGAKKGSSSGWLFRILPSLIIIGLLAGLIIPKINSMHQGVESLTTFSEEAQSHDLVLEDNSVFGYTAADFEDAILGKGEQQKKLVVYSKKVSDATVLKKTGLFNWDAFSKSQLITYQGYVDYSVDLSKLSKSDIDFDEEEKMITLRIPHAVQGKINIPVEEIQYGDVDKGMLAFGELQTTPAQIAEVQKEAAQKMQKGLDEGNVIEEADRFAILSVWEIYSPIVKRVAKDYSLKVEFR